MDSVSGIEKEEKQCYKYSNEAMVVKKVIFITTGTEKNSLLASCTERCFLFL
jgi:hypothetical protein